jgi:hypothetical protein
MLNANAGWPGKRFLPLRLEVAVRMRGADQPSEDWDILICAGIL